MTESTALQTRKVYQTDSSGKAAAIYEFGGKTYPMKVVKNCKVCHAPDGWRFRIENRILAGSSFLSIERDLPDEVDCPRRSISRHYKEGHMPLADTHRRMIIEEQAREMGLDPEEAENLLVNHVTFAHLGMAQIIQKMADGELEPDFKDGIALANLLDKIEERAGAGIDQATLQELIQVFFDAVMAEVGTDSVEAIARRAEGDPRMDMIRKQLLAANAKRTE